MTEQTTHFGPRYRTLDDIRLRKAQLLTDITKDSWTVERAYAQA